MAHGDYECCIICDSKLIYNPNSRPKQMLCAYCAADLTRLLRRQIKSVWQVYQWLDEETDPKRIRQILFKAGYKPCCFPNEFDEMVKKKLGTTDL